VEIIRKYEPWLAYWVSEKDGGQTQAINKGLERCTGELFNWINSDDLLTRGALGVVAREIGDADCLAGALQVFTGEVVKPPAVACGYTPSELLLSRGSAYKQPSSWLRTAKVREVGSLDPAYQYAFDCEFTIRYVLRYPLVKYVPDSLALFRMHPTSKTVSEQAKWYPESIQMLSAYRRLPQLANEQAAVEARMRSLRWNVQFAELSRADGAPLLRVGRLLAAALANPGPALHRGSGLMHGLLDCVRGARRAAAPDH
jgi:hypothetical protein